MQHSKPQWTKNSYNPPDHLAVWRFQPTYIEEQQKETLTSPRRGQVARGTFAPGYWWSLGIFSGHVFFRAVIQGNWLTKISHWSKPNAHALPKHWTLRSYSHCPTCSAGQWCFLLSMRFLDVGLTAHAVGKGKSPCHSIIPPSLPYAPASGSF